MPKNLKAADVDPVSADAPVKTVRARKKAKAKSKRKVVAAAPAEKIAHANVAKKEIVATVRRGVLKHDGKTYKRNDVLSLTIKEFDYLLRVGAINDPKGNAPPFGLGPAYNRDDEVKLLKVA